MNIKSPKKWNNYLFILSLVMLMLSACKTAITPTAAHLESTINSVSTTFSIKHLSYLVSENGNTVGEKFDAHSSDDMAELNKKAFHTLYAPLELDLYFKESIINGGDTLNKTFRSIRNNSIRYRDLLIVPADHFEPNSFRQDLVIKMINKIIITGRRKKKNALHVSKGFQAEFGIHDQKDLKVNYFKKISALSDHLIKSHAEFRQAQDTLVADLFPTWYAENKSLILGWKIFRLKNQIILWNFFNKGDSDILLIKFMNKDIFVSVSYDSKDIPTPFSYNKEDLLQSPLAIALIKDVLFQDDNKNDDAPGSVPWTERLKKIKNDDLRLLKIKELTAKARYYQQAGDKVKSNKLFESLLSITADPLLNRYINEKAVADIGYVSNNLNTSAEFTVDNDGYYQIFSGGQVTPMNDFSKTPYQYDNIQIYLNDHADRQTAKRDKTRLFHFNYRFNRIAGMQDDRHQDNWLQGSKVQFAFNDPTDSIYTLEVAIPWSEIRSDAQTRPCDIGLNVLIGDSDYSENQRESILSYATKPGEDWSDPLTYGHLFLRSAPSGKNSNIYSNSTKTQILIDGLSERNWKDVSHTQILYPYYGTVPSMDNSAVFKSLWDEKNLYFLFSITDNCKNRTGLITKDKCWIENLSTGELIWKLPAERGTYFPSNSVAQKLYLKSGRYVLRYLSDNSYSNEGWIGKAPRNYVYGGTIYKAIHD